MQFTLHSQKTLIAVFLTVSVFISQLHCLSEGLEAHSHRQQKNHHHHHEHRGEHSHDSQDSGQGLPEACCQSAMTAAVPDLLKKSASKVVNLYFANTYRLDILSSYNLIFSEKIERYVYYDEQKPPLHFLDSMSLIPNAPPVKSC